MFILDRLQFFQIAPTDYDCILQVQKSFGKSKANTRATAGNENDIIV
jgi:hypothetical protein